MRKLTALGHTAYFTEEEYRAMLKRWNPDEAEEYEYGDYIIRERCAVCTEARRCRECRFRGFNPPEKEGYGCIAVLDDFLERHGVKTGEFHSAIQIGSEYLVIACRFLDEANDYIRLIHAGLKQEMKWVFPFPWRLRND